MPSRVAVLFWFYRDLPICENRLELLRRQNPQVSIFGLYGGDPATAGRFRGALAPWLDDFWAFDEPRTSKWKWLHGDLMLAAWYEARGRDLEWDHVFVVQWDMLVLSPLGDLVPALEPDEVLLSGVVPVAEIERTWVWVKGGHEPDYEAFVSAIRAQFPAVEPMSCVFVIAALPRRLLAAYAELRDREIGYVEYRLPTLAQAIGLRLVEDDRMPAWRPAAADGVGPTRRQRYLSGTKAFILLPTVVVERCRRDGARVFHPYHGLFPFSPRWAPRSVWWAAVAAVRASRRAVGSRVVRASRTR